MKKEKIRKKEEENQPLGIPPLTSPKKVGPVISNQKTSSQFLSVISHHTYHPKTGVWLTH
jgi:hypothetical protein